MNLEIMNRKYLLLASISMMTAVSCDLDLYPETSYNEGNVNVESGSGSESQYTTRTDMEGLRNSIYESWTKDIQDGENKNVQRDWDWYLGQVSNCNNIIFNIDRIKESDPSMTDQEWKE